MGGPLASIRRPWTISPDFTHGTSPGGLPTLGACFFDSFAVFQETIMADFVRVCSVSDIPDPGKLVVEVDDHFVVVFHVAGVFSAIEDCCTHDGNALGEGELNGCEITCPRHGARFDIRTGKVLCMPALTDTPAHEVKVEDGAVFVKIRE
jgi:3-phenylpropionate/trans-cinnamate dioxygenase ferredoxin subunit